jgi:hypothetical protein
MVMPATRQDSAHEEECLVRQTNESWSERMQRMRCCMGASGGGLPGTPIIGGWVTPDLILLQVHVAKN